MIGKIIIGKSFNGCISYCLSDKKQQPEVKERADLIAFNQCFGDKKELIAQFNAVRQLTPGLAKPVMHITLSLAIGEQLSKDKWMEIAGHCAKEMGFENNQYIAVQHLDTRHQHLHIVANRIGFDGRAVSDSNNYKKIAALCRKMEQQYQLQQVASPRRFLSKEQQQLPRHDQRKSTMKADIQKCLTTSRSYRDFERLMKEKKYEVIKGRGIAFRDEKQVYVKGSELGYSLQKIEDIIEQNKLTQESKIPAKRKVIESSQGEDKKGLDQSDNKLSIDLDHLLQPEHTDDYMPFELTKRKPKRKNRQKPKL